MANTRRFEIEVLGDVSKASKALQQLGASGMKHLDGLTRAAKAMASAFVFDKLADGVSDLLEAARESEKVMKVTEAVIKATGGSAKLTAQQIGDLSTAISNKTGIDDEAIQAGQNLLLTFKSVREEVGAGNDMFTRASNAMVDLSATGFGSIDSAAKMLGKSLENPVKGLQALSRAGVTFTEDQKDMIFQMVASGKTLEAQKIIMKEVESQVGGVAEASANAADKMSVKWDNFKETLGTKLLPIADKFSQWAMDKAIPALEKMADWVEKHVVPALQDFAKWTQDNVIPALKTAGEWINDKVLPAFEKLGKWIADHWPQIARGFEATIKTIGTALEGIIKVGKGIVEFFQGVWKGDLDKVWEGVKKSVGTIWDGIKTTAENLGPEIGSAVKKWGPKILDNLTSAFKSVFIDLPSKLASSLASLGVEMGKRIAKGIADKVGGAISDAFKKINPFDNLTSGGADYSLAGGLDVGPELGSSGDMSYAMQPNRNDALAALVQAIKKQETGYLGPNRQYTAVGPQTRYGVATGAYQFLDSTWKSWGGSTKRAKDASASEQDAVASKAIAYYMQRYNGDPTLVAIAWHAGPGAADKVAAGKAKASDFKDGAAHTDSGSYAANVSRYYQSFLGSAGSGSSSDMGTKTYDTLSDIAGTLDLEATAMSDLLAAGYSESEAASKWRSAMLANNRDSQAAYRAIETELARGTDATLDVASATAGLSDTMSGSIEEIAAAFFAGLDKLASSIDKAAMGKAMSKATAGGTTMESGGLTWSLYATDPATGGTLFDADGNPIYASDTAAIAQRLAELGYGTPGFTPPPSKTSGGDAGVVPGYGTPRSLGDGATAAGAGAGAASQTINVVVDGQVLTSVVVGGMRKQGMVRPDGSLTVTR